MSASTYAWAGGTAVGGRMATFYGAIQATAAEGLGASIRNDPAYRRAAVAMVDGLRRGESQATFKVSTRKAGSVTLHFFEFG